MCLFDIGPKGLPIVGSLFDIIRGLKKAGDDFYFHQVALKYGPIAKVTSLGKSTKLEGVLVSVPDPTDAAADGLHHRYASEGESGRIGTALSCTSLLGWS